MSYHVPVMLTECLEGLSIKPGGTYIDVTFGGGGHSRAILEKLGEGGRLITFDRDPDAKAEAEKMKSDRFLFIDADFRFFKRYLEFNDINEADGILADLGVSSHQIDTPERGFSIRFEGPADMRMDPGSNLTAKAILNDYSEEQLADLFWRYGDLRNSRKLAAAIVEERKTNPFDTVEAFKKTAVQFARRGVENKYLAAAFQALRIEVNDEMDALEEFLEQSKELLKPGGRLAVLSYHSLEDRRVKNFMKTGNLKGIAEKDFYGNISTPFKLVTKKPVCASEREVQENRRSRSAKLRVAEKI